MIDGSDIVTSYRVGERASHGLHPGHQARRRFHACRWSNLVKKNLPKFQSVLPDDVKVSYEFDQSPYVTRAIGGLMLRRRAGRDVHRADGAVVSARLAQRVDRGASTFRCR